MLEVVWRLFYPQADFADSCYQHAKLPGCSYRLHFSKQNGLKQCWRYRFITLWQTKCHTGISFSLLLAQFKMNTNLSGRHRHAGILKILLSKTPSDHSCDVGFGLIIVADDIFSLPLKNNRKCFCPAENSLTE